MIQKKLSYKYEVYEKIKEDIITGVIKQGDVLNERKLSDELGISRTPIREALQLLHHDGWLIMETYKGTVVREFDIEYIKQVLNVRKSLEIEAVEEAIDKFSVEDLEYLEKNLKSQEDSLLDYNPASFMKFDRDFHNKIYQMSKNEILIGILNNLNDIIRYFGMKALQQPERNKSTLVEHKNIVRAIKEKDVENAKKCMEYHMIMTAENVCSYERELNATKSNMNE